MCVHINIFVYKYIWKCIKSEQQTKGNKNKANAYKSQWERNTKPQPSEMKSSKAKTRSDCELLEFWIKEKENWIFCLLCTIYTDRHTKYGMVWYILHIYVHTCVCVLVCKYTDYYCHCVNNNHSGHGYSSASDCPACSNWPTSSVCKGVLLKFLRAIAMTLCGFRNGWWMATRVKSWQRHSRKTFWPPTFNYK